MKEEIKEKLETAAVVVFSPVLALANGAVTAINRKYIKKPLGQFIEVDGHRMSVLVTGQGDRTIVFLPGLSRTCPILDFKPLFTQLKDRFKIVVPEKFGYGQSDIVRENRDYETIVEQYRKALSVLQIKPPYILCAHSLSGHDAEIWAQKYPEEVEAFIGIDANIANCPEINFNYDRLWWEDRFLERFYSITGYVRTADLYGLDKALTKKEVRILKELEVRNTGNYDVYSEEKNYLAAHALINSSPMPTQPTLQFVDTPEWYKDGVAQPHEKGEWDDYEIAWVKAHEDFAAASLNGKVLYYTSGHVMHHYDYVKMAGEIKEFLNAEK